ncbi:hypothetical protein VTK56DRAFT_5684 [Thermocarpiscus australiensis]
MVTENGAKSEPRLRCRFHPLIAADECKFAFDLSTLTLCMSHNAANCRNEPAGYDWVGKQAGYSNGALMPTTPTRLMSNRRHWQRRGQNRNSTHQQPPRYLSMACGYLRTLMLPAGCHQSHDWSPHPQRPLTADKRPRHRSKHVMRRCGICINLMIHG